MKAIGLPEDQSIDRSINQSVGQVINPSITGVDGLPIAEHPITELIDTGHTPDDRSIGLDGDELMEFIRLMIDGLVRPFTDSRWGVDVIRGRGFQPLKALPVPKLTPVEILVG